ncbi:hypothetical protein BJV78DRAFT_1181331 [Lactifluus subvellereus]|nr:hypothetical protein BJV78DRAFT_1181331 [Lactifluus subvellereus]
MHFGISVSQFLLTFQSVLFVPASFVGLLLTPYSTILGHAHLCLLIYLKSLVCAVD